MRNGILTAWLIVCLCGSAGAQSIHFSQFYNAPTLITPANTGLMPDNDYRIGLNYRNQWSALPVPYNTFAGWGDFKIGGNKDNGHNNWLGMGISVYSDKAGDGQLKLSQIQGSLAYHLQMSTTSMLSLGMSAATVSRSVNYDLLTFDAQWDGFGFNGRLPSGEKPGVVKANYYNVAAGLNYAWFPNENIFLKLGVGAFNLNKPVETFNSGGKNIIEMRQAATMDLMIKTGSVLILNPTVYYSQQSGAQELVAGLMVRTILSGGSTGNAPIELILGAYGRLAPPSTDAAIGTLGLKVGPVQFMASYDVTVSSLAPYNSSYGAMEFSLIYTGNYGRNRNSLKRSYNCPRFN